MSLEVKLEEQDHQFIKGLKDYWQYAKKQIIWLTLAAVFGFGLGKLYTWDTIMTDCKVLGMTRFVNTPMGCRVGETYK